MPPQGGFVFNDIIDAQKGFQMNAKTNKLRRKQCLGKVRFKSMGRAQKAAYAHYKNFGQKMNGYKCEFCDGFHIGHQ